MTEEKQTTVDEQDDLIEEVLIDHYELVFIVSANYTAEEVKPISAKVTELVKKNDGNITLEENLGKLKLAYPINHLSHAYYLLVEFDMNKQNLHKLNRQLKLTTEVLRYLVVKKKVKTQEELVQEKKLQEKLTKRKEEEIEKIKEEKVEEEKPKKKEEKEKMSLEDLDKKLDELLDTDDIV
ncbi:30S ribosomal protein S6 [Patescibacteria group bacterium]